MIEVILNILYIAACFVLIMFVLLQPSKSDASGVFGGGGANSTAFGPRGTQTVLAKVTITAAIVFFSIAFLFSIPGLFGKKSLGKSVGPAETQPAPPPASPPATDQSAPAGAPTGSTGQPAANVNANSNTKPVTSTNSNSAAANSAVKNANSGAAGASNATAAGAGKKDQSAAPKNEPVKK